MIHNKHNKTKQKQYRWSMNDKGPIFHYVCNCFSFSMLFSQRELITGRHEQKKKRKSKKAILKLTLFHKHNRLRSLMSERLDTSHRQSYSKPKRIVSTLDPLSSIRSSGEWNTCTTCKYHSPRQVAKSFSFSISSFYVHM